MRAIGLVLVLVLGAGCARLFGLDPPLIVVADAAVDAAPRCMSSMDCTDKAQPLCDTTSGLCVECITSGDCVGPKATCDGATHTCVSCVMHSDCPISQVCKPDGTCADASSVIYVDGSAGIDTGACTMAAPCKTITFAMTQAAGRTTMKLTNPINDCVSVSSAWTWLADGSAKLTPSCSSPTLGVSGGDLTIYDLEIDGGSMSTAILASSSTLRLFRARVTNAGKVAIDMRGGALDVSRSTIDNNVGGGIVTDASTAFDIESSFIVRNGNTNAGGGAYFGATTAGNNRFELNTVVDNMGKGDTALRTAGVGCPGGALLEMPNNLIARNTSSSGPDNTSALGCSFTNSLVQNDTSGLAFVSDATAPYDYHIGPNSSARDTAHPSTITIDVDSQTRPYGPANDFGADEYVP